MFRDEWITEQFIPIPVGQLWARYEGDDTDVPFDPPAPEDRRPLLVPVIGYLTGRNPECDAAGVRRTVAAVLSPDGCAVPATMLRVDGDEGMVRPRLASFTVDLPARAS